MSCAEMAINRVTGVPMELREPSASTTRARRGTPSIQAPAARGCMKTSRPGVGRPPAAVRVVLGDVGGNFVEIRATAPVRIFAGRRRQDGSGGRSGRSDRHGVFPADHPPPPTLTAAAELALDENGLALRATNTSNLGASAISFVPLAKGIAISSSVYDIPCSPCAAAWSSPHGADLGLPQRRAPGGRVRPRAHDRHRLPPPRLRPHRGPVAQPRPPTAMPYRNPLGLVDDSGDYPASLRRAATGRLDGGSRCAGREAHRRGRCRGIGVAMSIELNTGAPRERAELTIKPSGTVELVLGTMSAGQGHETSFAQLIAEWLGAEPERVSLVTGDTDRRAGWRRLGLGALDAPWLLGHRQGRRRHHRQGTPHRRRHARSRRAGYRIRTAIVSFYPLARARPTRCASVGLSPKWQGHRCRRGEQSICTKETRMADPGAPAGSAIGKFAQCSPR